MTYSEYEEFLTPDDFRRMGQEINKGELEKIDGHPLGDGEELNDRQSVLETKDDEVISIMPDGTKRYMSEDPGEMYKTRPIEKQSILLETTPEHLRKTLMKGTLITRTDNYGRFRRGFTQDEGPVVKRMLDENGRPIIEKKLTKYMALTEIKYGYRPRGNDNWISYLVKPGESFWSPRSGEVKKQK